jgi:hypothetical protein
MPNNSLMYSSFTPIFGNLNFNIAPSQTGQVNLSNGVMPYLSLEALIYQQQIQSAALPVAPPSGQVNGQQNVNGALTVTDNSGNIVAQISSGSLPSNGAAS